METLILIGPYIIMACSSDPKRQVHRWGQGLPIKVTVLPPSVSYVVNNCAS